MTTSNLRASAALLLCSGVFGQACVPPADSSADAATPSGIDATATDASGHDGSPSIDSGFGDAAAAEAGAVDAGSGDASDAQVWDAPSEASGPADAGTGDAGSACTPEFTAAWADAVRTTYKVAVVQMALTQTRTPAATRDGVSRTFGTSEVASVQETCTLASSSTAACSKTVAANVPPEVLVFSPNRRFVIFNKISVAIAASVAVDNSTQTISIGSVSYTVTQVTRITNVVTHSSAYSLYDLNSSAVVPIATGAGLAGLSVSSDGATVISQDANRLYLVDVSSKTSVSIESVSPDKAAASAILAADGATVVFVSRATNLPGANGQPALYRWVRAAKSHQVIAASQPIPECALLGDSSLTWVGCNDTVVNTGTGATVKRPAGETTTNMAPGVTKETNSAGTLYQVDNAGYGYFASTRTYRVTGQTWSTNQSSYVLARVTLAQPTESQTVSAGCSYYQYPGQSAQWGDGVVRGFPGGFWSFVGTYQYMSPSIHVVKTQSQGSFACGTMAELTMDNMSTTKQTGTLQAVPTDRVVSESPVL